MKENFDKLVSRSIHYQREGRYARALSLSSRAVDIAAGREGSGGKLRQALALSAKNAYYLGEFEESLEYIGRAESCGSFAAPARVRLEEAIVKANILRRKGLYGESLETLHAFDRLSAEETPGPLRGERLLVESACLYYLGRIDEARKRLETAMGFAGEDGEWKLRSRILIMSGLVMRRLGFTRKAADDFSRAADICRARDDHYGMAAAALDLGIVLYHEGRFDRAREELTEARDGFERIGWHLGVCRSLIARGDVACRMFEFDEALSLLSEALDISRRLRVYREKALALLSIARTHRDAGNEDIAKNCIESGLEAAGGIPSCEDVIASALTLRGELAMEDGDLKRAEEDLEEALGISEGSSGMMERGLARALLGMVRLRKGLLSEGMADIVEGRRAIRDSGSLFELARTAFMVSGLMPETAGVPAGPEDKGNSRFGYLLEARHLFDGMDSMAWPERVEKRLAAFSGCVPPHGPRDGECGRAVGEPVRLLFERGYEIADGMIAVSPAMQEVWNRIQFAASFSGPVLITGETGTGKELVARMVHETSERSGGPFVAVNCAAIPDHLFESEFFGHRKGCFTGASTDRKGFFEEAASGTLFLDEVGELSVSQQAKLLRVLQEGRVRRVGENSEIPIDIRIISATNQDLEERLAGGLLRPDFYYRINCEKIHLPPLRERPEDIIPLISWRLCGNGPAPEGLEIDCEALELLRNYHWPGNVRELLNILERIHSLDQEGLISVDMLPERFRTKVEAGAGSKICSVDGSSGTGRRQLLEKAMTVCKGNKSAAARWLGISRGTLYKELKETGLYGYYRYRPGT